jgi:hypothetical protein
MQQLRANYEPKTPYGHVAGFVGSLAPTLLLREVAPFQTLSKTGKEINLASKVGNMALTGGYQGGLIGGVSAQNKGENPFVGASQGALIGGGIGGALPVIGAGFEKVQPVIAQAMAGIPKESYKMALDATKRGENFFAGKFDKIKNYYPITEKINNAITQGFKTPEYFTGKFKEIGQQAENFANQYFTPDNAFHQGYRNIAEKIKGGGDYLNTVLGGMVGNQTKSLANDAPVPIMQLFDIISSSINQAGRGSSHNPSGQAAEYLGEALQKRLLNTALKPHGMTADDVLGAMENSGMSFRQVVESQGINLNELVIDRVGIHNEKEVLQDLMSYNADWKPHRGIIDKWQAGFNEILRENGNYAKANDEYRALKDILKEHPWLNNPDSIASKLSNSDGKSGALFNTQEKLQQFEDLLPNIYKFKGELENLLGKHQSQKALKANLSPSVYNNMGNYGKAPLDVQYAFEQLNAKSPSKFLDEALVLMEQQAQEKAQQKLLQKGLVNNPRNILNNKSEDAYNAFNQLDNSASEENKFMAELEKLKARQDFEQVHPHYGSDARIPMGHTALGVGASYSAMHGNFLPLLFGANASPALQKLMLQGYGVGSKFSKYLPRVITTGTSK